MEDDCGACAVGLADDLHLACGLTEGIFLHIDFAIAVNLGTQIVGESVDAADAHTVQTT